MTDFPVGPLVDTRPAQLPGPVTLQGRYGTVTRLAAGRHGPELWEAFRRHHEIWTYLSSYGPFTDGGAFSAWLRDRVPLTDPYYYVILDADGRAVGLSTLMEIRPVTRVIEVGHIVYSPALQRTRLGTEVQYMLARYTFEMLGYRRYEWKCNALNAPSRAAALRYGFVYEGTLRQRMIAKGRNRDDAYFSMLDSEWLARKHAFEQWLDPENFDGEGKQRISLIDLNKQA